METKRWVQHVSGQGEKWKVKDVPCNYEDHLSWCVEGMREGFDRSFFVPKSEYVLCEAPEVWRDVTDSIEVEGQRVTFPYPDAYTIFPQKYRLRKVSLVRPGSINGNAYAEQWAFIVEKRAP